MSKSCTANLQSLQQWDDITITITIRKTLKTNKSNDDNIDINFSPKEDNSRDKESKTIEQPLIQTEMTKLKQDMNMMKAEMKQLARDQQKKEDMTKADNGKRNIISPMKQGRAPSKKRLFQERAHNYESIFRPWKVRKNKASNDNNKNVPIEEITVHANKNYKNKAKQEKNVSTDSQSIQETGSSSSTDLGTPPLSPAQSLNLLK